ncbi:MAG: type II toxin-antitoxin system prevent-host-death family antitoxin [Streptosporangiales bacterium]|nr:type II toxin-antitoxin system prevent-host-death family antitoxin [Streptosporangiales bacterium]
MATEEIGVEQARAKLGELVSRAEYRGEITYLTRYGRRVAAVVPARIAEEHETSAGRPEYPRTSPKGDQP